MRKQEWNIKLQNLFDRRTIHNSNFKMLALNTLQFVSFSGGWNTVFTTDKLPQP